MQRFWRRSSRHTRRADNPTGRRTQDCQCNPFRCLGQERDGCRHTRIPCEPPHRTCPEAMHHPLQRGDGTDETPARRHCTQSTPLAHTARQICMQGKKSRMQQMWFDKHLPQLSKKSIYCPIIILKRELFLLKFRIFAVIYLRTIIINSINFQS